ncbi:glycosyltransferase [Maribacter ulvicola]|uniref:Glycosyltransferase involved in cell wall bisynthesis n=1 Tax=Maribacter ulvicola TaxID=228959 RepID=A0A1N6VJ71_9FLAO|nr:glycosyltransferase [Maribacter ulvicola]SIQ77824.1 Glycosyltransferase involved in cell wall bisynthesis [Maribacter ulvicola]
MAHKKIKILFIIPNLSPGGAERIMSYLASNIDVNSFDSEMIVLCKQRGEAFDLENLKVTYLKNERVLYAIPDLIKIIYTKKPNIVFGTLSHVNLVLGYISIFFPKVTFIARQTSITSVYNALNVKKKFDLFSIFLKQAFKNLDFIVCQSQDMLNDCIKLFDLQKQQLKVLSNPITDKFLVKNVKTKFEKQSNYHFITVGRFVNVKGHERILRILSKFKKPFTYTLVGNGPLKDTLFELANNLGISEKIIHIPYTKDVAHFLSNSDYFLQGSLSEGFPNALLESCAVGTPVLAFDVPGGTKEIVKNGVNGFLVDNEDEFLYQLNNLTPLNPDKVSNSVYKKFDKAIILKEYETFFKNSLT